MMKPIEDSTIAAVAPADISGSPVLIMGRSVTALVTVVEVVVVGMTSPE